MDKNLNFMNISLNYSNFVNFLKQNQFCLFLGFSMCFTMIVAIVECEQKKSGQTFYFIPQKWLILESKVKLKVKTMGQEL